MRLDMENNNKYFGFYRGVVLQQLTHGYCKIAIPGVLYFTNDDGDVDVNRLPPAECAADCFGGELNNGTFKYPDLNSTVWCFFENGNINKPIYFASANSNLLGWNSMKVAVPENKDIAGYSLTPVKVVGKSSEFIDTSISQTTTDNGKHSAIQLVVNHSADSAKTEVDKVDTSKGNPLGTAATVKLDNANKKVTITAANTIELNAPTIIINGIKLGSDSQLIINVDDIKCKATNEVELVNKCFNNSSDVVIIKSATDMRTMI